MPFSFTSSCKSLEQALSKATSVLSVASGQMQTYCLQAAKTGLNVIGFTADTFVSVAVDDVSAITGTGILSFDLKIMQGTIKGRSSMIFTFTDSVLKFKLEKGKYEGDFVTLPITDEQTALIKEFKTNSAADGQDVPREVVNSIKEGLKLTSVKDVYTDSYLNSFLILSKGVLSVSCFDNHHFGFYRVKVAASELNFRIALPSSHFNVIDKVSVGVDSLKFSISDASLRVSGKGFTVVLPAVQTKEENYSMVKDFVASLKKPVLSSAYNQDHLKTLISNLYTYYGENTKFTFKYKKGAATVAVEFKTASGSASDSLKIEAAADAFEFKIDPRLLKDTTSLLDGQGDTRIEYIKDHVLVLRAKTAGNAQVVLVNSLSE